jgi:hypothetical protein
MAGHPRLPASPANKVAWTIPEWAHAIGLSRSYVTALISKRAIDSVKLGYKRLITTSPSDFIKALPPDEPRRRNRRSRNDEDTGSQGGTARPSH